MEIVRCMIASTSQRLLADIVQKIAEGSNDVMVVERIDSIDEIPEAVKRSNPDVVILALKSNLLAEVCNDIVNKAPGTGVIGLVDNGRRLVVCFNNFGTNEIVNSIKMFGDLRVETIK